MEMALHDFSPFQLVFLRVTIAWIVLITFIYMRGRRLPHDLKSWGSYFVMGLISNVIPFSLIVWGQTQISAGEASILNAMTPIFTVLVAHMFTDDERLSKHKAAGVLIGFCGVILMMLPRLEGGITLHGYGQLAVLCAALSYGFSVVWGKRLSLQTPNVNATGMLMCSSALLLPLVLMFEPHFPQEPHYSSVLSVLSIAVFSTALAYILFFKILGGAGATNISLVTLLVPVSAIFLGSMFLGEVLGLYHVLGMICIFAGLVCIDGRFLRKVFK